jgi:hypothetical protein
VNCGGRDLQRRYQTEYEAGQHGQKHGETKRDEIYPNTVEKGDAECIQVTKHAPCSRCQYQAERCHARTQHHALREHLPDQTSAPGSESSPDGRFLCRVAARASSKFERFAHTVSITTPTAHARTKRARRRRPVTCSARRLSPG